MTGLSTFWGLTRFNLRHLLLSPVFLLVVPLSLVVLSLAAHSSALPNWRGLYSQAVVQAVGVAGAMFVATTFPAIREVRHSEGFALPLSPRTRLLSLAVASTGVTSVCMGVLMVLYVFGGPAPIAGVASPFALLRVVVMACCGPLAAIAAAAWTRSYGPLAALGLLVPAYLLYTLTTMGTPADVLLNQLGGVANWLFDPLPVNHPGVTELALLDLLHSLFLAAFLLMLASAARHRARAFRPAVLAVAGLLLAGAFGVSAYGGSTYTYESRFADERLHGARADPCRVREGVAYCPLPGYEPWVDHWHDALAPTMARVPEQGRDRLPVVWQGGEDFRVDVHSSPPAEMVRVYEHWDPVNPFYREDLALSGTMAVLGLSQETGYTCVASGQARIVVGAWLVAADERLSAGARRETAEYFLFRFSPTRTDLRLAHALLGLPEERVSTVLDEHWGTLVAPGTQSEDLADLMGLSLAGSDQIPDADWEEFVRAWGHPFDGRTRAQPACA